MSTIYPSIRRGAEIRILLQYEIDETTLEDISAWPVTADVRLDRPDGQVIGACAITRPDIFTVALSFITSTANPVGNYYVTGLVAPPGEPVMVTEAFVVQVRP